MRSLFSPTLAILLAAAALSACASSQRDDPRTGAALDTQQWEKKVAVETYPDEVLLALRPDGLSGNQAEALQAFLERWMLAEGGVIRLRAPQRPERPGEAAVITEAARDFLVARGAPAWRIETTTYDAKGAPPQGAPLVVSFDRHQVITPLCGTDMGNLTRSMTNRPPANFGCAVTSNLAAQIANPRDLLNPRDMDPADTGRRTTVLGKYRDGQVTSSARDEQASGAVSRAVN